MYQESERERERESDRERERESKSENESESEYNDLPRGPVAKTSVPTASNKQGMLWLQRQYNRSCKSQYLKNTYKNRQSHPIILLARAQIMG